MQQPNLLILDEPTNDLDIVTLNILEEYLKEYKGSLIIVSHDRHFLDRLVDHLFVFTGDGVVKDFVGDYSEYRETLKELEAERKKAAKSAAAPAAPAGKKSPAAPAPAGRRKLSWKENHELEELEKALPALEAEKALLEEKLSGGSLSAAELQEATLRYGALQGELDAAETRWLELTL